MILSIGELDSSHLDLPRLYLGTGCTLLASSDGIVIGSDKICRRQRKRRGWNG